MEIISLGCGGGRHQVLEQTFKTGGFRVHAGVKLHVDPGPGALLLTRQLGLDPKDLDGVLVSHSHTDHCSDAEVLIEAVGRGSSGKGRFIGSESAVYGADNLAPAISEHHQRRIGEVVSLKPGDSFDFEGVEIEATPTKHSDPKGIGFQMYTDEGAIGYSGDTGYFNELPSFFEGSRVLIANVTRPRDERIEGHLCSDDLIKILEAVRPEVTLIIHMGMLFLRNSPKDEADYVERSTGVRTLPGNMGARIEVGREVKVGQVSRQSKIGRFS